MVDTPDILAEGWDAWGDPRALAGVDEISATVSTNRVYRLRLEDGGTVVSKVSSYGSYVHFRQDHERIHRWCMGLRGTPWDGMLAGVLHRNDTPFVHREGPSWLAFYEDVGAGEPLPPILDEDDIAALAREMARLHDASAKLGLAATWKTLGADVAILRERLEHRGWCDARNLGPASASFLREHCDAFLWNADRGDYHGFRKLPVLVDWNLGNFAISRTGDGFRLASRWDYDWFRIEPRVMDFYFLARVVGARGDRSHFTYDVDPFLDPRFALFLRAYHEVSPLSRQEIGFLREAYRFFLLNYAVLEAEHFFRPELCDVLRRDVVELHLPALADFDLSRLLDAIA